MAEGLVLVRKSSLAFWSVTEIVMLPHWCSLHFWNFLPTVYKPTVRKLHPPTGGCRGLKRSWKINNILTVPEHILWGNRCSLLLLFIKLPSHVSWVHSFLGSAEIANGLCWDYKKKLGGTVLFFIVFIRGQSLASQRERETGSEGMTSLEVKVCIDPKLWNCFYRKAFIFLFIWKALGRGQSVNKTELY